MEIHTKDKDMKQILKDGKKHINPKQARLWSEYELRLLIQDEISCKDEEERRLIKLLNSQSKPSTQ